MAQSKQIEFGLAERIRWLRFVLPPVLVLVVILYQLGVAQSLERNYGHVVHYSVEIGFYSLTGPLVTWLTLVWVERRLVERDRLERQVRARTEQLASLTAASADAIFSLDRANRVTSWNRGAERMLGYEPSAVIGRPVTRLLPEEEKLTRYLGQEGTIQGLETVARSKNGRLLSVELTETRLGDVDDTSPSTLIIMRDITVRREREAVREEERARISRDLHDGVAQTLYFLALKADMVRQQLNVRSGQASEELKEIGQIARRVIRDVRRTIYALRPLDWSEGNFLEALRQFVDGFAEQMGWRVSFDSSDKDIIVPARLEPTLFRLVQESLNNIAKHAQAEQVWITLKRSEDGAKLLVTIRDDGQGFDHQQQGTNGLGLDQMKARVLARGGSFNLESQVEAGTTIKAILDMRET